MRYNIYILPFVFAMRFWRRLKYSLYYPLKSKVYAKMWRANIGDDVLFVGDTYVRSYEYGAIVIGDRTKFVSGTRNNLVGLMNPTVICACQGAKIVIGHDSGFSSVVIHSVKNVSVGNYVKVGGNVRIFDHDFHPVEWERRRPPEQGVFTRAKEIVIGDDVFIGTNAIILKGAKIGDRSVIAAGSVVVGIDAPSDSLIAGNPARVVKALR